MELEQGGMLSHYAWDIIFNGNVNNSSFSVEQLFRINRSIS